MPKIRIEPPGDDGLLVLKIPIEKPRLSGTLKTYMLARLQGESADWGVDINGVKHQVRVSIMAYVKIPKAKRQQLRADRDKDLPPVAADVELS